MARRALRSAAVVVMTVVGLGVGPSAAGAADAAAAERSGEGGPPATPPGASVTGGFAGTGEWEFDTACGFVHHVFVGTYDPDRRGIPDGTYSVDACVPGQDEEGWIVTGTFEVVTGLGVTLQGTASGHMEITGTNVLGLQLTLTVTDSSGTHRPVRGTISAVGTTDQSVGFGTTVEQGNFSADLHVVRS